MKDPINARRISNLVQHANQDRAMSDLPRRLLKLLEEIGETAQAYLCVTSESPSKPKTWDDVREEAADVLIVTLDILMIPGIEGEDDYRLLNTIPISTHDDDVPDLLRRIARCACDIGDHLCISLWNSEAMAQCAYQLTERVFDDDASLIEVVERKIVKWITSQNRHPEELVDGHQDQSP